MKRVFEVAGLAGIIWSIVLAVVISLVTLSKGTFTIRDLIVPAALGLMFWRLAELRQWAALGGCIYAGWMIFGSLQSGIPMWTAGWAGVTAVLCAIVAAGWKTLRPGL